jgi:uncharacterized protein YbbC (DUF1343 family)
MRSTLMLPALLAVFLAWRAQAEVRLGSDVLAARDFQELRGKRVGLIANQSSANARGVSTIQRLRQAPGVMLVALFAPEHGIDSDLPAGREFTNSIHRATGLPVYSLYGPGPVRRPTPAMLKGLDVLIYEVQDTGFRPYTYISTMGLAMDACGAAGVRFMVLDRPNPLGGQRVEGPLLDPAFRSFVGQWDIPLIYGLTAGELARMINGERWISNRCQLTVVAMTGWKRSMTWRDTGLRWTPTSPNVRTFATALGLPATGLVGEIGGLNIGLGGPHPFQCFAAPWLDANKTATFFNGLKLPGVRFHPVTFTSPRGAYNGQTVQGARIEFTAPATAPLAALNFHALDAARKLGRRDLFAEAQKAGKSFAMFDKVVGTDKVRRALQAGQSAASIVASWKAGEDAFRRRRQSYLLYP